MGGRWWGGFHWTFHAATILLSPFFPLTTTHLTHASIWMNNWKRHCWRHTHRFRAAAHVTWLAAVASRWAGKPLKISHKSITTFRALTTTICGCYAPTTNHMSPSNVLSFLATQMVTSKLHSKFNKLPVKIETATNPFVVDNSSVWDHVNQVSPLYISMLRALLTFVTSLQLNATDDLSHIVVSFLQDKIRKDHCNATTQVLEDQLDRDSDHDDDDVIAVEATLEDVLSIPTDLDDNCPTLAQPVLPTTTCPVQDKTAEVDGDVSKAEPRVDEVTMTTKSKIERVLEQSNVVLLESEAIGDEGGTRTVWSTADVTLKRSRKRSEEVATRLLCICNVIRGLSFLPGNATEIFRNRSLMRSLAGLMLIRHKHRKLANRATLGRDQDSSRTGDTPKDSYQCFGGPSSDQQVNEYSWFTPKRPVTSSTRRSHRIYSSTVLDDREESSDVYNDTWWWNHVRRMREDAMVILCNITHCIDLSELPDDHTALALLEACLHWSICPSSEASDPFNLEDHSKYPHPPPIFFQLIFLLFSVSVFHRKIFRWKFWQNWVWKIQMWILFSLHAPIVESKSSFPTWLVTCDVIDARCQYLYADHIDWW